MAVLSLLAQSLVFQSCAFSEWAQLSGDTWNPLLPFPHCSDSAAAQNSQLSISFAYSDVLCALLLFELEYSFTLCFLSTKDSQVRQSATYSLHQPQGNKEHGTERSGNLYKKSDG